MTPKSDVTLFNPPTSAQAGSADFVAQWSEARNAYPLYAALAMQFNFGALPHPAGELPPQRPTREVFDAVLKWLDGIDARVRAFQIRQLPPETLNASEQNLRAFLQRQLRKQEKTTADRDKIDLLLVQYFALCAPEELYRKEIHLEDVAEVLQPVLAGADATRLEWCEPLDKILDKVANCESLRDMMELGLLEQGRLVKESAGAMFYDPAALVAFCRFNFLLRRAFIRMLHADLSAVRQAAETLDANGVKTVDCRRAGFSAAETTTQLRYYCENWKQPFHKDYGNVRHACFRTTPGLARRPRRSSRAWQIRRVFSVYRRRNAPARQAFHRRSNFEASEACHAARRRCPSIAGDSARAETIQLARRGKIRVAKTRKLRRHRR